VERELAGVARKYPGSLWVQEGAGLVLVVPGYPIPPGFSPAPIRVAIKVGVLYPAEKLDLFWIDPALKRLDGGTLPNIMSNDVHLAGQSWLQISWHDNAPHAPERVSILGYLLGLRQWFVGQAQAA
jgi:hypothetical protein